MGEGAGGVGEARVATNPQPQTKRARRGVININTDGGICVYIHTAYTCIYATDERLTKSAQRSE